jgi:hypothetical protein
MSTVAEISKALSGLNDEELRQVEKALISNYRQRKTGIIYDDAYGVWTEEEQVSAAAEVLAIIDKTEAKSEPNRKP